MEYQLAMPSWKATWPFVCGSGAVFNTQVLSVINCGYAVFIWEALRYS